MPTFSKRYGYNPQNQSEPVLEDAPIWTRSGYVDQILDPFTFIDDDLRYENKEGRPLGIKALIKTICTQLRKDIDYSSATDSWYCRDYLHGLVKDSEWYQFYDIVEMVAREVRGVENYWQGNVALHGNQIAIFGFKSYLSLVNDLFASDNIGWRLDSQGLLIREFPEPLARRIDSVRTDLVDEFEPARVHYDKAVRYANTRPIDPENSIKEIVSATESLGRVLFPQANTLGDVVREMRKANALPQHLVSVIEKFYAYACAEPAVRHGAPVPSRVVVDDAEFCLHMGAALIRYLIAYSKRGKN